MLLAASEASDATTDACFAIVVLAKILWIGQHGFEELQRYNLNDLLAAAIGLGSLVLHFVDTAHADVLYNVEISEILLAESHPETCTLDGRIIDDEGLYLLVVKQITLLRTNTRIGQRLMNLHRFCLDVLTVLPVKALLCNLADVDFGIEVCGECFVVIARIAVHDVEVLNLVEVMLGGIGCEDACHARVETAAKNGTKASLLKAFTICPLPRILEVCLVLRFIVSCVEIVAPCLQASLHDGKVLIGQRKVHDQVRLVTAKQL